MFVMTYLAYYLRLTSLSTFSEVDKYIKFIPMIAFLELVPDVIIYIYGAWVSIPKAAAADGAVSGCIVMLTFFCYYGILLKKMFGYLTISKKSVFLKVVAIVTLLLIVDVSLIALNFTDTKVYNSVYNFSFTVKLVALIELFDEDSWM